jgi:hypothetical protein
MTTLFQLLLLLAPLLHRVPLWEQCVADATAPALDHVVLAVRDLELASAAFEKHGFRLKRGRLHPNNLLNRHIKFRDGSEIEPGDLLASLKASRCGPARSPDGQVGERWALSRGTIVVVPAGRSARPRVLGVVLQSRTPPNTTLQPLGNFWVRYQR